MAELPPSVIEHQADGSVVITVGEERGTVSSGHLVEPKLRQVQQAWLKAQGEGAAYLG